jgi:cell division protease FtsH
LSQSSSSEDSDSQLPASDYSSDDSHSHQSINNKDHQGAISEGYDSDTELSVSSEGSSRSPSPAPRLSHRHLPTGSAPAGGDDESSEEDSDFSYEETPQPKRQRVNAGGAPNRRAIDDLALLKDEDMEVDEEDDEDMELEPISLLDVLFGNVDGLKSGSGKVNKAEYLKASGLPEGQREAHWNTIVKHYETVVGTFADKQKWIGQKMDETFSNPNLTNAQKNEIFHEGRRLQSALNKFLEKHAQTSEAAAEATLSDASSSQGKLGDERSDASGASNDSKSDTEDAVLPFDTNAVTRLESGIKAFEKLLPEFKSGWLNPDQLSVGFDQVAGAEEPKRICRQVVDMLKHPEKYEKLNARVPKGLLFSGPPGVGKTLLAKAIAKEAGVPFCSKAGSDFVEIYVGQGAKSIRDLIDQAKLRQPCIVFIDEIDALGRERSSDNNNRESDNTLNQLLVEMDGAKDKNPQILWIGATNRPELLDKALVRRLEKEVNFSAPGLEDRKQLFQLYSKDRPMADDVDMEMMAYLTRGFSGAEVSKLLNEAAIQAAYAGKEKIGQSELNRAHEEIHLGTANTTLTMTPLEKQKVAYHEAGHAIVGHLLGYHPVFCITVTPRERALGLTTFMPEEDYANPTHDLLMSDLATCYGGRAAEGLVFGSGKISVGAHGDLDAARRIATDMVTKYGYTDDQRTMAGGSGIESSNAVDERVAKLMGEGQKKAEKILAANRDKLDKLAAMLVDKNTVYRNKFLDIVGPSPIPHPGEAKPIAMITATD